MCRGDCWALLLLPQSPSQGRSPWPGTLRRASPTGLPRAARLHSQLGSNTAPRALKPGKKSHKQQKPTHPTKKHPKRTQIKSTPAREGAAHLRHGFPRGALGGILLKKHPSPHGVEAALVGIILVLMEADVHSNTLFGYCCLYRARTSSKQWEEPWGCLAAADVRALLVHF